MRAFARAGAVPRLRFLAEALEGRERLDDADILCLPGGFSFGDHLGAGAVAGLALRTRLRSQLEACRQRPMLCICNGFQMAARAGCFGPGVALATNACGTFKDVPQQPHLVEPATECAWLAGLQGHTLVFPCAHGEGRFVFERSDGWRPALRYPEGRNPDGSMEGIAGVSTPDGLLLGIMNHPERAIDREANLTLFENGVRAAR
jgi:phosphoribosylformylglycinamidine (FGAM) synthase-like amidotransferase family enzyme